MLSLTHFSLIVIISAVTVKAEESGLHVVEFDNDDRIVRSFHHDDVGHFGTRVKRNSDGTVTKVQAVNQSSIFECYQYTWPGINENNTTPDCARIRKFTPCFTPFVFTNDSTVPEPEVVKEYCRVRGCKVTCPKTTTNTCIRYAYYLNDNPKNITYFCGSVQDTTDSVPLSTGEVWDTVGGEVRRVKFCQTDFCNSSHSVRWSILLTCLLYLTIKLLA